MSLPAPSDLTDAYNAVLTVADADRLLTTKSLGFTHEDEDGETVEGDESLGDALAWLSTRPGPHEIELSGQTAIIINGRPEERVLYFPPYGTKQQTVAGHEALYRLGTRTGAILTPERVDSVHSSTGEIIDACRSWVSLTGYRPPEASVFTRTDLNTD